MVDISGLGFWKYWAQKSEWQAIMIKYPEAASVVQQVCKVCGATIK
jgi:hypothetical protein